MFDRFGPSLKNRAQLEARRFDLNRSNRNSERYVIPMHRIIFGLTSGCRTLEITFVDGRCISMILLCSTKKVGDRLKKRED